MNQIAKLKYYVFEIRAKREALEREIQLLRHAEQYHAAELARLESEPQHAEEQKVEIPLGSSEAAILPVVQ